MNFLTGFFYIFSFTYTRTVLKYLDEPIFEPSRKGSQCVRGYSIRGKPSQSQRGKLWWNQWFICAIAFHFYYFAHHVISPLEIITVRASVHSLHWFYIWLLPAALSENRCDIYDSQYPYVCVMMGWWKKFHN